MLRDDSFGSLDPVIHTRNLATAGARSEFSDRSRRGQYVALFRGVHIAAAHWNALDRHEKYRTRVRAAVESALEPVIVSHESAAAVWRLPFVGEWPTKVHILAPRATGGRSNEMFARHAVGLPSACVQLDGTDATTLERTVVDLATRLSFPHAVVVADAALRRSDHPIRAVPATAASLESLRAELECVPLTRGSSRARRVIEFSSGLADRPGESLSRVGMHLAGITPPELQVRLRGRSGREYIVDFWWRRYGIIGEFDGRAKYSDPEFLRGRTPERALLDEKAREDDLRAVGHGMSRWGWSIAISPPLLAAHLASAGIR